MAEYKIPTNEAEFNENFALKKPLMSDTEAYYESSRCLFCYDAPCVTACPTGIDIPLFIKQINTKNTVGAARTIYESNWMGNACGTICPTGVLCEGACVHNHQDVPVIQIGRLQNFATKHVIDTKKNLFTPGVTNNYKVGIIGAGPASIACACELRILGYQVDIFEAKDQPSGLTVYGIAPYKITNEEVLDEVEYLRMQLGFNIEYNKAVQTKENIVQLEKEYDAIFLGVGLGTTAQLEIPGEDLKGVVGAVEFIEELRMKQHKVERGSRVVVIGGGNTAMDAASELARLGAESVTIAYRRTQDRMSAYKFEYKLAISSGVKSVFNAQPIRIEGDDVATGVTFVKTESIDGNLSNIEGSEFTLPCDMVIKATGQGKQTDLFDLIKGLERDAKRRVIVDKDLFQTTNPKYFAGGDAINGGAEVVNAAHDGKMAAHGIDKWLKSRIPE